MSVVEEVTSFLTNVSANGGAFFLATVDGDQPALRPLGFKMVVDDKLYLGIGTFKAAFKQIQANPKVQLAAYDGKTWIRVTATAAIKDDPALVDRCFEIAPHLKATYEKNGWEMGIIALENGTVQWIENAMVVTRTEAL